MTAAALLVGYLVGGIPTADWLARRRGLDLRARGSRNPGANNALRLGGRRLAAAVLTAEVGKGALAVLLGGLGDDAGAVAAGIGAVLGNVSNPYRRLRGGQGLGITAGILLTAAPVVGLVAILVIWTTVVVTRNAAAAAVAAMIGLIATAALAGSGPWGLTDTGHVVALALGVCAVIAPKQVMKLRPPARPTPPAPG
ncbi:MAG TPA: glycerol-3-phosphate acyltransferase [Acidimicrobiia bacterium]|nr:glycerol-3-phosphate acyltransferase [Acidimicrobiia bacterium]